MVDFRSARVDADSADTLKIFAGLGALSLAAAAGVVVHGARCVSVCVYCGVVMGERWMVLD